MFDILCFRILYLTKVDRKSLCKDNTFIYNRKIILNNFNK